MPTRANRRIRVAMIAVTVIFLLLTGAVFKITSDRIQAERADFCTFAAQVSAGAHKLSQVPGRVQAERAYARLQAQLGCEGGR